MTAPRVRGLEAADLVGRVVQTLDVNGDAISVSYVRGVEAACESLRAWLHGLHSEDDEEVR